MTKAHHCEKCGRAVQGYGVGLELNAVTSTLHPEEAGEVPPEESQGCFSFGPDCAKKILANGGSADFEFIGGEW